MDKKKQPIIITGLSGAGISSVLKAMEDFGFEVFDNLPLSFISDLLEQEGSAKSSNGIAIGLDTRTRGFSPDAVLGMVKDTGAKLVFMTCDHGVLQTRFSETRRRHPLAKDKSVSHGIEAERALLRSMHKKADIVIDTSETSIHDLRHILEVHFAPDPEENLTISLMSFGFKNGAPKSADMIMDVRFLKNPHWDKLLKPKTGLDEAVGAYIREDEDFETFLTNFKTLLKPLLPRYAEEGKSYLTIAIGCTGGRHRSVYSVETLKRWFESEGMNVFAEHRDLKA